MLNCVQNIDAEENTVSEVSLLTVLNSHERETLFLNYKLKIKHGKLQQHGNAVNEIDLL